MAVNPEVIFFERTRKSVKALVEIIDEILFKNAKNPQYKYDNALIDGEPTVYERNKVAVEYIDEGDRFTVICFANKEQEQRIITAHKRGV